MLTRFALLLGGHAFCEFVPAFEAFPRDNRRAEKTEQSRADPIQLVERKGKDKD